MTFHRGGRIRRRHLAVYGRFLRSRLSIVPRLSGKRQLAPKNFEKIYDSGCGFRAVNIPLPMGLALLSLLLLLFTVRKQPSVSK